MYICYHGNSVIATASTPLSMISYRKTVYVTLCSMVDILEVFNELKDSFSIPRIIPQTLPFLEKCQIETY